MKCDFPHDRPCLAAIAMLSLYAVAIHPPFMWRAFLIFLVIVAVIWLGERYFADHPNTVAFLEPSVDSPPAASSTPTPVDHSINGCRTDLRKLTRQVLLPLDSKDFSATAAAAELQRVEGDLDALKSDPGYPRLAQACSAIGQVLQARQDFAIRLARDEATPAPGTLSPLRTSTLQTASLQPSGTQAAASGTQTSEAFFKERVLKEWQERCAQYRPALDGLLAGSD